MPNFTVREYALIGIEYLGCPENQLDCAYIPESAFNHLCDLAASFSQHGAKVFELAGRKKLKLDQYVGVIETPCGTRLEILPKHVEIQVGEDPQHVIEQERGLLQNMLTVSLKLKAREVGSANLKCYKQPLYEWVMTQFLQCFEQLLQHGLRFDYQRVQDEQKYLRGQLQHVQYMRQSPTKKHIFPIEHDVYELNRAENRLIRTALEVVCKKTQDAHNWQLAQELRLKTNDIPKSHNIAQDFKQWQSCRLLALYSDIKPWTELILGEQMPLATVGDWHGMSLLFPMEKLFEHYVAYYLKQYLHGWQVQTQVASHSLCKQGDQAIFRLKPDILLEDQSSQELKVIDTKWKLLDQNNARGRFGLKDSDLQQMFAYSAFYLAHQHEVLMIYPARTSFYHPLKTFEFQYGHSCLRVIPFDLDVQPNSAKGQQFLDWVLGIDKKKHMDEKSDVGQSNQIAMI